MRKFIVLFFILYAVVFSANNDKYLDFDDASNKALKENKYILLIVTKNSCKYCNQLLNITIKDDKIKSELDKSYILSVVNQSNSDYPIRYYSSIVPATFIINPERDKEEEMILGFVKPDKFLKLIQK